MERKVLPFSPLGSAREASTYARTADVCEQVNASQGGASMPLSCSLTAISGLALLRLLFSPLATAQPHGL